MSFNTTKTMSSSAPPAIHVGPILTPGSNETISILIPLSGQLTTVPSQILDQSCRDCGKGTTGNSVRQRSTSSMGCPFPTCSRYGRAFSRAHDLKRHITRHENRKERLSDVVNIDIHTCQECGQDFGSEAVLQNHLRIHGKTEGLLDPTSIMEAQVFTCHVCKKDFSQESKLKAHLTIHDKKLVCNICALCGSRFNGNEELQFHMREHTESILGTGSPLQQLESSPQSEEANERVILQEDEGEDEEPLLRSQDTNIAVGEKNVNTGSGTIRCDYCWKTFKSKWTLNSHVAAHEGRFQFDCNQCGKKFVRKTHFEGHMRSHEAARPYICDQCGKTFKELKHRREHAKRKHTGNQIAIQNLLDSISACVSEDSSAEQPKFTLLMPMDFNV